jgi:2-polyprenyl-3-methyl-5-hydroxy-6-metoxy-1,4-benzoquinol methylase
MQKTNKGNIDNPYHNPMSSAERRARYEYAIANDCILPMLVNWGLKFNQRRVLDLGCGSGGLSLVMAQRGAICLGIDHNPHRITEARQYASASGVDVRYLVGNILEMHDLDEVFDLIVLAEVIEHLVNTENVELVLRWCKRHLAESGSVFISFPPWFNPFGGHQAGWPVIRYIPWFHLFPNRIKKIFIPHHIQSYLEFVSELNRLTIRSFERAINHSELMKIRKELYNIRPEFQFRYKIPPIKQSSWMSRIPFIAEATSTGAYYLLSLEI